MADQLQTRVEWEGTAAVTLQKRVETKSAHQANNAHAKPGDDPRRAISGS